MKNVSLEVELVLKNGNKYRFYYLCEMVSWRKCFKPYYVGLFLGVSSIADSCRFEKCLGSISTKPLAEN